MTTTAATVTLRVPTSELRAGDLVHTSGGMRVRIPEPTPSLALPDPNDGRGIVWHARGVIENPDDVPADLVPLSWRREPEYDGIDRWTIQGNDLAYWTVERPA